MDSVSGVGVIDKGVTILRALRSGPCSLAELQSSTGLPRATAYRLAAALEEHGLVRRDTDGRFALGVELVALGHAAAASFPLAAIARTALERLRDEVGESVQFYVREPGGRRAVVSLQSPHLLQWVVHEGALLPLDRGSAGKVLGGGLDVAESVGEREAGAASASAAVRDRSGAVIGAVSVSGPIERVSRTPLQRYEAALRRAAADIAATLR